MAWIDAAERPDVAPEEEFLRRKAATLAKANAQLTTPGDAAADSVFPAAPSETVDGVTRISGGKNTTAAPTHSTLEIPETDRAFHSPTKLTSPDTPWAESDVDADDDADTTAVPADEAANVGTHDADTTVVAARSDDGWDDGTMPSPPDERVATATEPKRASEIDCNLVGDALYSALEDALDSAPAPTPKKRTSRPQSAGRQRPSTRSSAVDRALDK